MKKYLTILFLFFTVSSFAQSVKTKALDYVKLIPPTQVNLESPVDMTVQHVGKTKDLKDLIYTANIQKPYYVNNNSANPKYIAVVEYIYNKPYTFHEKSSTSHHIIIKSNIQAVTYLIELGKGVFAIDSIHISNPRNSSNMEYINETSAAINENIEEAKIGPYFDENGFPSKQKVDEVDVNQIIRLSRIALRRINSKVTNTVEDARITFRYLKEDKNFDNTRCNEAFDIVNNSLKPLQVDKLKEASAIYRDELIKYQGEDNKKINAYKIALLENILTISYLVDDYEQADQDMASLLALEPKNRIVSWFASTKTTYNERIQNSKLGDLLQYVSIPQNVLDVSTDTVLLLQSPNIEEQKIEKLRYSDVRIYIDPVFELNNIAYYLMALEQKDLFIKYQNDLFNEILWYMMQYKLNLDKIRSSDKREMNDFITFCADFKKRVEENSVFGRSDNRDEKLRKLREFVSNNYTIEEFTKYAPSILRTVELASAEKKAVTAAVYKYALKSNAIIQLRGLLADDNYKEAERIEYEKLLNEAVEEGVTKSYYIKNKTYFEFKKSIELLKAIQYKRGLSEDEIKNYQILMEELVIKFIYNV